MNVSEAIRLKRAVRKFTPDPLPEEVTLAILHAGRRAQSSKNTQPWRFIAITDRAILYQLSQCGETDSEGRHNTWHLSGAALAVAIVHPDPSEKFQTLFDVGQAAAYMQLAAWDMGVGSCLASIYQVEKACQTLALPAGWHLRIAISFGFPQQAEKLTQPPKTGGRLSLEDIVYWEQWK